MSDIGERLRGERLRLGLSQAEVAAVAGLHKNSQSLYESGTRAPDAYYLTAVSKVGIDIFYVLTGQVHLGAVIPDESDLLTEYRQLNISGKAAVRSLVRTCIENSALTVAREPESRCAQDPDKPSGENKPASAPLQGARQRASRHRAERMAALDEKAVETVQRAMEVIGEHRLKHPTPKRDDTKQG